ncbi:glycosyl hydrolase family 18 protein [Chitinibacter sp. SCUT-21]|uniref:chitinase n=1 Tax=Chitinibacter sp. SCUT-21 TaxID=2970891 RepID=UPI0035A6CAF8
MKQRTMMRRTRIAAVIGGLLLAASVSAATWQEGNTYTAGTVVDYNGKTYSALVTHTAYVGANWNPAATPTLWKETGTSSTTPVPSTTPTATPVVTSAPTATPAVSAKPTATPTVAPTNAPTATPVSGVAAWSSTAVYNGGQRVSYNGAVYEAKWWTQGNQPGADQWGPWKLVSGTPATPTPTASPTPTATPVLPTPCPVAPGGDCIGVSPSPTPTATPVVTATPTPAPTATPCTSDCPTLPKHAVVGYWHNFDNGSGVIRIKDVPDEYDIINVSFVEGDPWTKGKATFVLDKLFNEAEFIADIKEKQAKGKIVQVSLGGANGTIVIDSPAARDVFIQSLGDIIAKYGFNGVDIDIENNLSIASGEDFRNPTTPQVVNLVAGVKALKKRFGPGFTLTMAPETAYVQGGYGVSGGIWGGYLGIIHGLRDDLNLLHVQHYNSGGITGKDDKTYTQGTVDFQVAMTDMLLTGFNVGRDPNKFFPPLRPDQVGIGLPSIPAAAPSGGYMNNAEVQKALDCLMKLQNCGTYKPTAAQPDLRGVMTWSINWDKTNGYSFAKGHKAYLNTYPK